MANFLAPAAFAASQALVTQGITVKRSHLAEVIAALLGYRTYAALSTEEANSALDFHLDDAEFIVLNLGMGTERASDLGLNPTVTVACVEAMRAVVTHAQVFEGIAEFYDSHARQALAEAIHIDDDVASAMAESNASFVDEPELSIECPPTDDLWASVNEWKIEADGYMTGEYDPDGDRMFNGDTLNCRGWLMYQKAGRAGLVFQESGAGAGADDSLRDRDYEDEREYLEYQRSLKAR